MDNQPTVDQQQIHPINVADVNQVAALVAALEQQRPEAIPTLVATLTRVAEVAQHSSNAAHAAQQAA